MPGRRFTESQRRELLQQFQARRESIQQFTKRHGVSATSLYHWRQAMDADPHPGFIELKPEVAPSGSSKLILQYGSIALHFQTLPDTAWLTELIQQIQ